VRADLATQSAGTRSVVLAHAFVVGGESCESERDITVGGVATVPAGTFAGVDYVALGHLHGRQRVSETVRYSGSPLAYSFSEEHQVKGCWLVDLGAGGAVTATALDAPVPRRIARLRGDLDDLLSSAAYASYEDCWLQVTLTDAVRPREPMERLRRRFPHTLALAFEPTGADLEVQSYAERVRGRSDLDVALDFVAHVRGRGADDAERALLDEAFSAVRAAEALV
jgi:exonuclease SbcD